MQELVDAGTVLAGVVEHEVNVWGETQAEGIGKLMTDVSDGIVERSGAFLLLFFVSLNGNVDARGFASGRHDDFIDRDKANARIGKLSGNDDDEFFFDRLNETILMMLGVAIFQEQTPCALK